MRKILSILLCAVLVAATFAGCAARTDTKTNTENEKKLNIVCTVFPIYDWVKNIVDEDSAKVTMLLNSGADLHSYQPTADDIIKVSTCDMFIYVGGESDEWVDDALDNATNRDMVVINLLSVLGDRAKEEEIVEGMQAEEEEEEGEAEEEGPEYDEHVWLSLKNADVFVGEIAAKLGALDAQNKATYDERARDYRAKLTALDAQYQQVTDSAKTKTLLFGDRFPFRYLTEDYGLNYYAAFIGCSAETEASFETVTFLANKADELKLKNIMVIETGDKKIAETIRANTKDKNQRILTLHSMQSTVSADDTYLNIMEQNLEVLKTALN